jgi:hypothetical protein
MMQGGIVSKVKDALAAQPKWENDARIAQHIWQRTEGVPSEWFRGLVRRWLEKGLFDL